MHKKDWGPDAFAGPTPPFDFPMRDGGAPEDHGGRPDSPEFSSVKQMELLVRLHHQAFRSQFAKTGLPPAQMGSLKLIIDHPGMSQRQLADRLHIQRATTTVMLQKMERAGYVDRQPDQEDQRISRIYPTEAALQLDAETEKRITAYFVRCFSGVSQEALSQLAATVGKITANLRTILSAAAESTERE